MKYITPLLLVLALAIGGYFLFRDTPEPDQATSPTPTATPVATQTPAGQTAAPEGAYTTYNSNVIASTAGTKILFFHAPWCPQCRALEKSIEEGDIPSGVTIIKVDYDSNQALRQKYGVTIQTTLVKVDDSGNLVEKYVAYEKPTLQALQDNLL
jgi:thiol-disulfide isomerase/thioredoxin